MRDIRTWASWTLQYYKQLRYNALWFLDRYVIIKSLPDITLISRIDYYTSYSLRNHNQAIPSRVIKGHT